VKKPVVHRVAAAGEVPYTGGWKAYNQPPFGNLSFFKDASGVVHLTGLACAKDFQDPSLCTTEALTSGVEQIFTLPQGFRPKAQQVFTTLSFGSGEHEHARVDVTTSGVVKFVAPPTGGIAWLSFDGVSFLAR
jgi:hypothetical protein